MASELGQRLRLERRRRKETQDQAAARFGISQPAYHRWETGEHRPGDEHFANIAGYLGASLEEVYAMLHQGRLPTTLDELRSEVAALQRDVEDLRTLRDALTEVQRLRDHEQGLEGRIADLEERLRRADNPGVKKRG